MADDDLNGLDLPEFGFLPFDLYVIAKWNPASLSTTQQKKQLVEEWIQLGKYGRRQYLGAIPLPEEIPNNVPQNLLSPRERAHNGQIERTLFIRTWYGDYNDPASQEKADVDYAHLVEVISTEYGEMRLMIDEFFIFDDKEQFSSSSSILSTQSSDVEFSDGVAIPTPGCIPSYVLTALMHCPDQIDGSRIENLGAFPPAEEVEDWQMLLVLVADRKACEEGWVLHLAINHRGQVLPFRIRDGADWVSVSCGNWSDGQQLRENTLNPEEDVELYMDRGGSGWN